MAESTPIVTTVPETVSVDTGADTATLGNLNKAFEDFWQESDTGPGPQKEAPASREPPPKAPAAPAETGPGQETTKQAPATQVPAAGEPKPIPLIEAKPRAREPVSPSAEPHEYSDDEIERLSTKPDARPEIIRDFTVIKNAWKADRDKLKAARETEAKLQGELTEARANSLTPELKADYENASRIRRQVAIAEDPQFQVTYQAPILNQYNRIIDEAVAALPNRKLAEEWAADVRKSYGPDTLTREWWINDVAGQIQDEGKRIGLIGRINQLFDLQEARNNELIRHSQDQSGFERWQAERVKADTDRIRGEIMAEIGIQEKRFSNYMPRETASAKTIEERSAIEAHNQRWTELNNFFQQKMIDIQKSGPRAWVRTAVEATASYVLEQQNKDLAEELTSVKAERDRLQAELDKIQGARRRLANTTGTPPTPTGSGSNNGRPSGPTGLSIKSLDVRKAFEDYNWSEGQ